MRKSVVKLNLDECTILERIEETSELQKFDMNKALDSDDEYNMVKRRSRTKAELAIVRPWQNQIMSDFLDMLFKEADENILMRTTVMAKYNEAGVPITWARLASKNTMFEKKTNFPPWSLAEKVTIVLPLLSQEDNLSNLEFSIVNILTEKIDQQRDKFVLPVRVVDIQKEIQLRLEIRDPPLFIILKQVDTTLENLFYRLLEERGNIRKGVLNYLRDKYASDDWSHTLAATLNTNDVHLFMEFSL